MNNLELLQKLVEIDSVFPNEQKISLYLQEYLEKIGFEVETVTTDKNRNNLIATYGKSKKYLGFYAHMDTVPRDEEGAHDPHKLVVQGDKAFGLGAEDMKGAIVNILHTAEFAVKHKLPMKIIFAVDEEAISKGAHDLVNSKKLNNISFLVSGESGQIKDFEQPFSVVYGRKGRLLFELEVSGKKSHAADSTHGKNAIVDASRLVNLFTKIHLKKNKYLGETEFIVQSIHSDTTSFSIPDKCVVRCSVLTVPGVNSELVIKKIKSVADLHKIAVKVKLVERETPYGDAYEIDRKNIFLKRLEKEIFTPNKVTPIYTGSVADENIFANKLSIPVISVGPIGGGGHTKDEWLSLKSFHKMENVYKSILELYNT